MMKSIGAQFRAHSIAFISLFVAFSSLAYNTWRNEETEANRNVRTAGIALLLKLGELDRVVFFSHYDKDTVRGNPHSGWAYALTISDLGQLTGRPVADSAQELVDIWKTNWTGLGQSDEAASKISDSIEKTRSIVLDVIAALD